MPISSSPTWRDGDGSPRDLGRAYVVVNIPDYTLKVMDHGAMVWTTKIVAGQPGEKATPLLSEDDEIYHRQTRPGTCRRRSSTMSIFRPWRRIPQRSSASGSSSSTIGTVPCESTSRRARGNALGRIRFNFPNKFLVYQHDTPDKHLFAKDKRAFSHGCMRVQFPDKYAEVLFNIANPKDGYTIEKNPPDVRQLASATSNPHDPLFRCTLTYQTAFVDDAGHLAIREDVYGRDSRLLAAAKRAKTGELRTCRSSAGKPAFRRNARLPARHCRSPPRVHSSAAFFSVGLRSEPPTLPAVGATLVGRP